MIRETLPDIKTAWEHAYFGMIDDKPGVIDFYQRNIVHSFGNLLRADSAVFDFDLGNPLGMTITKWSKFTGQYVDVPSLMAWVNNAPNVKTYDALWTFKIVPPNFTGKKAVHQWGNCLLGYSFRRKPTPVLSLYTRAQSLGFSGIADYALSDFVAKQLAIRLGIRQEEIALEIHCANFIIKTVEIVHYLTGIGKIEEYRAKKNRISEAIEYYLVYMDRPEDEIKWRAAKRYSQKLDKVRHGGLKSFPVSNLTLKGWHAQSLIIPKRTAREASTYILADRGVRRMGVGEMEMEMDDAVLLKL
jgi:hypothetical protein